ncbi:MAG: alpha-amylase, partial [Leptothrix sp. (in: Bacteria)]|nr:alpha-amylase [Leptothrix sp. (in: b-proteobacteria)]
LSGGEVNVWSYNPSLGTTIPRIGDVISTSGRAGNRVYIYGTGLGGTPTVKFGTATATVVAATDTMIEALVPATAAPGVLSITVVKSANTSNAFRYEVLSGDQVQVNFKVDATTVFGQNVYVVGSIPELGSWDPAKAPEAMMNPNYPQWFLPVSVPKGTLFEFKFIKKDSNGVVTWEGGNNRVFTSPSSSTGAVDTSAYTWQ